MAGEGKITKEDLSVKDPFQYLTESAKIAQAQVDSLAKDLDLILPKTQALLNGKSNSIADIQAQTKAMDVLIARQKQARQAEEALTKTEQALAKARVEQIRIEQAREKNIDRYNQQVERNLRTEQKLVKEQEKLNSAYNKVQSGLNSLSNRYRDLAIKKEMGETLSAKEEIRLGRLQVLTLKYDAALKQVDANMGRHQRNVGNYASGWNGLGNSINQLSREMPAFANSIQTGFMALSNNIPMLFDELSKTKQVNADLIKQGQPTTSMWSQVGKSIFSFQTLLSVGVTLLTIYGAKLVGVVSEMFKSTKAIDGNKIAQDKLNESKKEGTQKAQEELVQLKVNLGVAKDVTKSYEQRSLAVEDLQKQYPDFLGNLSKEAILAGNTKDAENALTDAILKRAKAAAAIGKITENQSKLIDLEEKLRLMPYKIKAQQALVDEIDKRALLESKYSTREGLSPVRSIIEQKRLNDIKSEQIALEKELNQLTIVNNRLTTYAIDNTVLFAKELDKKNTSTDNSTDKQIKYNKNFDDYLKLKQKELDLLNSVQFDNSNTDAQVIASAKAVVYEKELNKLMVNNAGNVDQQKQASEELVKAKTKLLELEFKLAIIGKSEQEIAELRAKLELDIYNLKEKQNKSTEEVAKKEKTRLENIKDIAKATEDLNKIVTDYYTNVLQTRIEYIDQSLELVGRRMSIIEDKAANGNIRAEESLKKQLEMQKELNDEKMKAESRIARLNLFSGILSTAGSIVQGFETGTEHEIGNYIKPNLSGVGIDNTLIRVHGKERIVNEDLSKQIVGRKTSDVVKNALAYEQMMRYPMAQTIDMSETNELLRKVANKPNIEYQLGEITQATLDIVRKEVSGNRETNHIFKAKYKA